MKEFKYLTEKELNKGEYITLPKKIYTNTLYRENLSNDSIVLYGFLLDRFTLSKVNNLKDKQGRVFVIATLETIMNILNVSKGKARSVVKELIEAKLLKVEKMKGFNSTRRFYIGDIGDKKCYSEGTNSNTRKEQKLSPNKPYINKHNFNNSKDKLNFSYLKEFDFEE